MLVQICPQPTLVLSLGVSCLKWSGGSSGGLQTTVTPSAEAMGLAEELEHWVPSTLSSSDPTDFATCPKPRASVRKLFYLSF